ncbi:hypothetical protein FNF27_03108 [Cafeteria roenbergensis]|uniref:U3 small nucleolar RNA-associated protein 22 n=1 Tax=Cafeteria roenbergensis TaxID=33653 RepID=A0A5A8EDS0_CAFRO|nr:hypothetical protein FNF27_03108 [Cafeteria roenbergensis]
MAGAPGSVLAMQVDALESAVSVPYDSLGLASLALRSAREAVLAAPAGALTWSKDALPGLQRAGVRVEGTALQFRAPEEAGVRVGGSFLLRSMVRPATSIDMMVEMPAEAEEGKDAMLGPRDAKNAAYADKRSLYLSRLAKSLAACPDVERVDLEALGHDLQWPCLRVRPRWGLLQLRQEADEAGEALPEVEPEAHRERPGKRPRPASAGAATVKAADRARDEAAALARVPAVVRQFSLRVIVTVPAAALGPVALRPLWNNIARLTHADRPQPPTPVYNGRMLAECTAEPWRRAAHAVTSELPVIARVAGLLKTWARRRGLHRSFDGWSGFALTALTVAMAEDGVFAACEVDAASALRAALLWLADTDLTQRTMWVRGVVAAASEPDGIDEDDEDDEASSDVGSDEDDDDDDEEEEEEDDDDDDEEAADAGSEGDGADDSTDEEAAAGEVHFPADDKAAEEDFRAAYACCIILDVRGAPRANLTWAVSAAACKELQAEAAVACTALGHPGPRLAALAVGTDPATLEAAGLLTKAGAAVPPPTGTALPVRDGVEMPTAVSTVQSAPLADAFSAVFGAPVSPHERWDLVISFPLPPRPADVVATLAGRPAVVAGAASAAAASRKRGRVEPAGALPGAKAEPTTDGAAFRALAAEEETATGALPGSDADAMLDRPWHVFALQRAEDILQRGFEGRATALRVLPCVSRPAGGAGGKRRDDAADWAAPDELVWASGLAPQGPVAAAGQDRDAVPARSPAVVGAWVCLRLDPSAAFKATVRGPAAGDGSGRRAQQAAAAFRALWGPKAQLRRFKDGAVVESAVFGGPDTHRTAVPLRIATHLLALHLGVPADAVSAPSLPLDAMLERPVPMAARSADAAGPTRWATTSAAAFAQLDAAATRLRAVLGDLGLAVPLKVRDVRLVGPAARGTSELPPCPHPLAGGRAARTAAFGVLATGDAAGSADASPERAAVSAAAAAAAGETTASQVLPVVDGVIQLESSQRWPDEPDAIAATRTALLLRMASAIEDRFGVASGKKKRSHTSETALEAGVGGKDTGVVAVASHSGLVVMLDGFAFRLRLHYPREMVVLAKIARRTVRGVLSPAMIAAAAGAAASSAAVAADAALPIAVDPALEGVLDDDPSAAARPVAGFVNVGELNPSAAGFGIANSAIPVIQTRVGPAEAARRLADLRLSCVLRPRHADLARALAQRVPAFGAAVRLARMWLRAQGLAAALPHEATELLCAQAFCDPRPGVIPATPLPAFTRFLTLLADHDWAGAPLLVDLGGEATADDHRTLLARFRAIRAAKREDGSPGGAPAFIVSPLLRAAGRWQAAWTRSAPSAGALGLLVSRARASLLALKAWRRASLHPEWVVASLVAGRSAKADGVAALPAPASSVTALAAIAARGPQMGGAGAVLAKSGLASLPERAARVLAAAMANTADASAAWALADLSATALAAVRAADWLGHSVLASAMAASSSEAAAPAPRGKRGKKGKASSTAAAAAPSAEAIAAAVSVSRLGSPLAWAAPEGTEAGTGSLLPHFATPGATGRASSTPVDFAAWRALFAPAAALHGADLVLSLDASLLPRRDGWLVGASAQLCPDPEDAHSQELGGFTGALGADMGASAAALRAALARAKGSKAKRAPASHAASSAATSMLALPAAANTADEARTHLLPAMDAAASLVADLNDKFGSVATFVLDDASSASVGVFLRGKAAGAVAGKSGLAEALGHAAASAAAAAASGGKASKPEPAALAEAGTSWLAVLDVVKGARAAGAGLITGVRLGAGQ